MGEVRLERRAPGMMTRVFPWDVRRSTSYDANEVDVQDCYPQKCLSAPRSCRLRSKAIVPFNGLFKNVFERGGQVAVRELQRTRLILLGAVFLYQLVLLYQFE